MKKYFSFSELKLWRRDRNEYIKQYVEGQEFVPNSAMRLGTILHEAIENPKVDWQRQMREEGYTHKQVFAARKILDKAYFLRLPEPEFMMTTTLDEEVPLIAIFDGFDSENRFLDENKTTDNSEIWNQRIVDRHLQLSFYAMVYWLKQRRFFRRIRLHRCNTISGTIKTYETARGPSDIDVIMRITRTTIREIKARGLWEKRLSREDRANLRNEKLPL